MDRRGRRHVVLRLGHGGNCCLRHRRNLGKIAVARRLLDLIYYMLKKGQDYRASKPRAVTSA